MAISNPFTTNSDDNLGNNSNIDPNINSTQQSQTNISNNQLNSAFNFNKSSSIRQNIPVSNTTNTIQSQQTVANTSNNANIAGQKGNSVADSQNTFSTNVSINNSTSSSLPGNSNINIQQNLQNSSQINQQDNNASDNSIRTNKSDKPTTVADLNSKFLSSEGQNTILTNQTDINNSATSDYLVPNNVSNDGPSINQEDRKKTTQPQYTGSDTTNLLNNNLAKESVESLNNDVRQPSNLIKQTSDSLTSDKNLDALVNDPTTMKVENLNTSTDTDLPNLSGDISNINKEKLDRNIHQADKRFMVKMIFLLSLILFLIVAGVVIYVYFI